MDVEKNTYGLSEGVFKACQFLGLKFPPEAVNTPQPLPSDYFGNDFEFDSIMIDKLCSERNWTKERFDTLYKLFSNKFSSQRCFIRQTKTDLNVYFCDYVLFSERQTGAFYEDYFDLAFYEKPPELQKRFLTQTYRNTIKIICNDTCYIELATDKSQTNKLFSDFIHRDWLDTRTCTFEEFKVFVDKYPSFFSKMPSLAGGTGAKIISVDSNDNLEDLFADLKNQGRIIEEVVVQHESLQAFCPDTVNTIRFNTILDVHNVVHILTASGRFGRKGGVVDNIAAGGFYVIINPLTGVICSEGISKAGEHLQKHPDSGKTFEGFQYPCWKKLRATVIKMAKMIPQLRYLGWDITINDKNDVVLIEINAIAPDISLQQSPDFEHGSLYLYKPLVQELQNYQNEQMDTLGYKVNNLSNFISSYELNPTFWNPKRKFAISKLIPDCASLMDLGCRKEKFIKAVTPPLVSKYYPVDYKNYDDEEIIVCNFNEGEFPDLKADTCLSVLTAEYVEFLPQFLSNMCNAAQKQILMMCRPFNKRINDYWRRTNPFLVDFTEEFLVKTMMQNNFNLNAKYPMPDNNLIILYDFRRTETAVKPSSVISDYYTLAITKNLSSEDGLLKLSARQDLSTSLYS